MAKTLIEEDLRMNIVINGDRGKKEINDLEEKLDGLNKQLTANNARLKDMERSGKAGTKQYEQLRGQTDKLSASIDKGNEKLQSLYRQTQNNPMTMSELQRHIRLINIELKNTDPKSPQWKILNRELADAKQRFRELAEQSKL